MPTRVFLNIYDLVAPLNDVIKVFGTGAFHGGVDVYGDEWSYGFSYNGTGIFRSDPQKCLGPKFREALDMGETPLTQEAVHDLIEGLKGEWLGKDYDLLRHNCVLFANTLCEKLGVGRVPMWVTNLAAAGAKIGDGMIISASAAQRTAMIAAAKAGEIDAKYAIKGKATAKAQDILAAGKRLEGKFRITDHVQDMAAILSKTKARVDESTTATKCDLCTLM